MVRKRLLTTPKPAGIKSGRLPQPQSDLHAESKKVGGCLLLNRVASSVALVDRATFLLLNSNRAKETKSSGKLTLSHSVRLC